MRGGVFWGVGLAFGGEFGRLGTGSLMPLGPTRKGVFAALMLCVSAGVPTLGARSVDLETRLARVKYLLEDRQPAEALVILEEILQSHPNAPGVRYQAALAHHLLGDSEQAQALVDEAVTRGETDEELHLLMGAVAFYREDFTAAKQAYSKVLAVNDTNSVALYNLSEILRREGRFDEAVEKLQQASKIDTKSKVLPLKIKLAQIESGQELEVIELEVLKRQGEENLSEEWMLTAAAIHLKRGNDRQATEMLLKARAAMGEASLRALLQEDNFFKSYRNHVALVETIGPPEDNGEHSVE